MQKLHKLFNPSRTPQNRPIDEKQIKNETNIATVVEAIKRHDLPREVVPTGMLNTAEMWDALLEKMPMTAMICSLATMTRVGLLVPMNKAADVIAERLTDASRLRKARILNFWLGRIICKVRPIFGRGRIVP
jgi:hypothetical protein